MSTKILTPSYCNTKAYKTRKMKKLINGICHLLLVMLSTEIIWAQDCESVTLESITDPGIYEVSTLTESDGIRNGPDYAGATVYYPVGATPPFASIAIVPGFISAESTIQNWGPFLASHGIVVITIGTNSLLDNPYARKDALLDAIITISEENTRIESPLFGSIDSERIAVSGWSMGGGGAQLAAAADPTIKAVVALCPWLDSQTEASDIDHAVPVLIFSAELDAIAPPSAHANIHYDYTPQTTAKLLFEIDNDGHQAANSPTGGQGDVGKTALSWLKHYLLDDNCYCPLLLETPDSASEYMTNVDCSGNPSSIASLDEKNTISKLYPNPSKGNINLEVVKLTDQMSYEIFSITGTTVSRGQLVNLKTSIETENFPAGVYIMNVVSAESTERIQFIVH